MFKILLFIMVLATPALADYTINCPAENVVNAYNKTIGNTSYFNTMYNATDCVVTTAVPPAALTAQQTAAANFNTDTFVQQLATTVLISNPNLFPYYAVLKDMTFYKNFQGLANTISALLNSGAINQADVDTVDNALENQEVNLDSYNSQVNVAY